MHKRQVLFVAMIGALILFSGLVATASLVASIEGISVAAQLINTKER